MRRARIVASLPGRWVRLLRSHPLPPPPRLYYGIDDVPAAGEAVSGGLVKLQQLQRAFPSTPHGFNVLYLGSNTLPPDYAPLIALAHRRGVPVVWNQNGVAYEGWHGSGWERVNAPMRRGLHAADHVFFQSEFCRVGADRFLGELGAAAEVLHNAVDTQHFTPVASRPSRPLTLLLGGNQYQRYRFEAAVRTLAVLRGEQADARLLVTGELSWAPAQEARRDAHALLAELALEESVSFLGAYTQREAAEVLRQGDILLHTKYNDPCPSVVIEAMACGLPVAYSASGGVPELVGEEGGVGVPAPLDWEQDHPPGADELAAAVLTIAARLDEYAAAARERAVERFDVRPWLERHRQVFEQLLT